MFNNKHVDILDQWTADIQNSIIRDFDQLSEQEAPNWTPENQIALVGVFSFLIGISDHEKDGPPFRRLYYKKLSNLFELDRNTVIATINSTHKRMDEVSYSVLSQTHFSDYEEQMECLFASLTHAFLKEYTDWQDNEATFEFMKMRIQFFWSVCMTQL